MTLLTKGLFFFNDYETDFIFHIDGVSPFPIFRKGTGREGHRR